MATISTDENYDDRSYLNPFEDYNGKSENLQVESTEIKFTTEFLSKLQSCVIKLQSELDSNVKSIFSCGEKIYTGICGIALLNLLYDKLNVKDIVKSDAVIKAKHLILDIADNVCLSDRISFLNGNVGILTVAAVINYHNGNESKTSACIEKLLTFSKYALRSDSSLPDELLYGRAGYLYALLFIRKNVASAQFPPSIIEKHITQIIQKILQSGRALAIFNPDSNSRVKAPLKYMWHGKEYVGAAHGYCGILHTLLLACQENFLSDSDAHSFVKPTVDFVLHLQYSTKNIPSSVNSKNYDTLVQWCHGAPGGIHMAVLAYKVFKEQKYFNAAVEFGEVTWRRGLLKKGYSLCHGVTGNAYTFLKLYQLTNDPKYLHRATKFAEWCFTYSSKQELVPDRPYSLFEGLAGVIYFLLDLQQPKTAAFPAVEL